MIIALLFLILFALLFPKAMKFLLALALICGVAALSQAHAKKHLSFRAAEMATVHKGEGPACIAFDGDHLITLRGDIIQSATTEESEGVPPHKYMAILLDVPLCDDPGKNTILEVGPLPMKWLGHQVAITGTMEAGDSWSFNVKSVIPAAEADPFERLSCDTIYRNGWDKMPDVADYIKMKPGSAKLGFGSACQLGSLVFAQCFLEPRWSVKKAIDVLIHKAIKGEQLPKTPACGA